MSVRPSPLRRTAASLLAAALILTAPGLEAYRVFAQEIVRPVIPISPAGGAGASAAGGALTLPSAPGGATLSAPLALPSTVIGAPAPAPVVSQVHASASAAPHSIPLPAARGEGKVSGVPSVAAPQAAAHPNPLPATRGEGERGGALLRKLLWRDSRPGRAAEPTALGRWVKRLSGPSLIPSKDGKDEALSQAGEADFAQRRGAESLPLPRDGGEGKGEEAGARELPQKTTLERPSVEPRHAGRLAVEGPGNAPELRIEPVRPGDSLRTHYRSILFPTIAAGTAAALWVAALLIPSVVSWAGAAAGAQAAIDAVELSRAAWLLHAGWLAVSTAALVSAVTLGAYAVMDAAFLFTTLWAGGNVSEEEFHGAVRAALRSMGLGPGSVAGLAGHVPGGGVIHAYRGGNLKTKLSFGFTTPHGVYLRPELARFPWLLRLVLRHELYHYQQSRARAPPGSPARPEEGFLRSLAHEISSRYKEVSGGAWLSTLKVPVLERVLREAQVSLSLPYSYDVVVVKPQADTVGDPAEFKALSGGRAQVSPVEELDALDARTGPARMIVASGASQWLPQGDSDQARRQRLRLERALKQLDERYLVSKGLMPTGAAGRDQGSRLLDDIARRQRRSGASEGARLQRILSALWRQVASSQIKDIPALAAIGKLYSGLQDRGVMLLPFGPSDPGVDVLLKLLRYWEGPDGGRLQVARVDLPEGGHVLVARKLESRVHLWLKPLDGRVLKTSTTNISRDPLKAAKAEEVLREAGFSDEQLAEFKAAGVEVRHAFGADVGENRVFISAPKRQAKFLKRYAERAGASIDASQGGYKVHLLDSLPAQNLPQTWRLRVEGEGGRIFDIDTGIDLTHPDFAGEVAALAENGTPNPRVSSYDVTGEGDNDFIGHGTHKASISYANGTLYKGMAPKAEGRMGKVFTREGFGASDGDIMAAAAEAMRWGADVVSLSLGSPGDTGDALSVFFSNLAEQKNSKGHKPIITASMGNSGPFNRTGSQPAAGENVIAVAAAAKSLDDKEPEVSFFSSVGFARDTRFHMPRWALKPSITALGGDVITRPGSKDVYEKGIEAAKSKDMEPSPSDTTDRLHTRMSGTSMSNPMIAGIVLLVKQLALRYASTPESASADSGAKNFILEKLPFAMRVILERSAVDMRVPIAFQGAGLVDAFAAARLAVKTVGGPEIDPETGWRKVIRWPLTIGKRLFTPESADADSGVDWIARAKAVQDVEKAVYEAAEKAFNDADKAAQAKARQDNHPEAPREEPPAAPQAGDLAHAAAQRTFNAARDMATPALVEALSDPVWLVRYYAALALLNMRAPSAALKLAESAVGDADGRVRQAASLALAATPSYAADQLLVRAAQDARPDVALYAAYALARHGDASAVARILAEVTSSDKKARFTAAWLIGEIGAKAGRAGADALGGRVRDSGERGNIRHLSVAALSEVAAADPESITDEAVVALLDASGAHDLALTRTISKFFSSASRRRVIAERMRVEPLRPRIMEFILANKGWVGKPGALGEMVSLLARILNVPLDVPSPAPDPEGTGVPGVDPNLGPVHLIVEAPQAARIEKFQDFRGLAAPKAAEPRVGAAEAASGLGLDPQTLQRHEAAIQVAMPVSQTLWINVPDSKVAAFSAELEAKGYKVHRARAKYRLLKDTGPQSGAPELQERLGLTGKGVLVVYLDEGGDLSHPGIARERIGPMRNFSEEGGPEDVTSESVGHGTHGMGIVGARGVEGSPYAGMAPDARFAVGKVLGANGGSDAMVMAGMEWAASLVDALKTPVIVNMSLGGPGEPDSPLSKLVNKLQLQDVAVVAAAGNEGPQEGTVGSPGNAALAFRVGAVDKAGKLTFYSSRDVPGAKPIFFWLHRGGAVDFDLPNPYEIISTLATSLAEKLKDAASTVKWNEKPLYQTMSGTSMAAPHVTGQLAQLAQRMAEVLLKDGATLPHGYWLWLGKLVSGTAQKLPDLKPHEGGSGLFDARAAAQALEEALKNPKKVRSEAEALAKEAEERFGGGGASKGGFWLKPVRMAARLVRSWLAPTLTGYTFPTDRLAIPLAAALMASSAAAKQPAAAGAWWRDASATRAAVSVPLYALRRAKDDPGIGKLTDLGSYFRGELAKAGERVVHLLPHFAVSGESPYAPVSPFAINEDYLDWAAVEEVRGDPALRAKLSVEDLKLRQSVDYASLREREGEVARAAFASFKARHLGRDTARGRDYDSFVAENASWLDDYAAYRAASEILKKPAMDRTEADIARVKADPRFGDLGELHRYAQWNAYGQLRGALAAVHQAGGRVLFDIPMFSAKESVLAWKRPELFKDLRTRNPGIDNDYVHENWVELALWNWTKLKSEGYRPILDAYRHWLDLGFDGARADALHFAYSFGNGQHASGDEPGDDFVQALSRVFAEREAFPLAEAFEGKAKNAERFGFTTVYGDWKKLSSHDDPRGGGFMARFLDLARQGVSGRSSRFVGDTLGDEWGDPFPVKSMEGGKSHWRYRIPLPSDPDYANRAPADVRAQLAAAEASINGDVWSAKEAVGEAFRRAAGFFVKTINGAVQIWAASMDWFLEEWGRDTFISLPGLLLSTGRHADAKENIRRFASFEKGGLIPNRIRGDHADYNTVDGSMWFVQAVRQYGEASGDRAFAAELLPVLRRILKSYAEGTGYRMHGRFNRIAMDSDGLIMSPAQATWMDADPDGKDRPVTPRDGKAVEINALWYSNLRTLARLEREAGEAAAAGALDARAELVKKSFNEKFWFETAENGKAWGGSGGALRDVVEGDPHGEAIRPNMLFAVSHGGDLLSPERARAVVLAATKDLLTPYGLRTLSYRDGGYRSRYDTSQPPAVKDQAYHQGTAWPWLIGAYADALARVRKDQGWDDARIQAEARALVTPLVEFLARSPEGSLPEVFDGGDFDQALKGFSLDDPEGLAPVIAGMARAQNRGGTRSQAWSVAEPLRVLRGRGVF